MDARSLLAVLAIFFLLWLIRTWVNWDSKEKMARKSRQRLRNRLLDSSLGERIGKSSSISARRVGDDEVPEQRGLFTDEQSPTTSVDTILAAGSTLAGSTLAGAGDASDSELSDCDENQPDQSTPKTNDRDVLAEGIASVEFSRLQQRLELAEAKAAASEKNDLELRRLRSELTSLKAEKFSATARIDELEKRIVEQQHVLEQANQDQDRNADMVKLQQKAAEREQQNEELRARLAAMSAESNANAGSEYHGDGSEDAPEQKSVSQKNIVQGATEESGNTQDAQAATRQIFKPLFQAPSHRDDLKLIKGIGPVMERTLNELGVTTFSQLASFTRTDIDKVSEAIGSFPGRIERDDWVGKARQFVNGQSTV